MRVFKLFRLVPLAGLSLAGCTETSTIRVEERSPQLEMADIYSEACEADNGSLWGVSLCGPLLIVSPENRDVWASDSDGFGTLEPSSEGWVGALPPGVPIANTALQWSGRHWVMVMYPFSGSLEDRRVLVMHEAWHRIQNEIELAAQPSNASHLDKMEGRILLRLELRALHAALQASAEPRKQAIEDALAFRAARLALYPDLAQEEVALDRNEGLASYTGVKLGATQPEEYAAATLKQYDNHEAYTRSYAYASGPAYGLLLDAYSTDWRDKIQDLSPADLLGQILNLSPEQVAWEDRAMGYGGSNIEVEEEARFQERKAELDAIRETFSDPAALILPLRNMQLEFDPNKIVPIEGMGSLYGGLTLRDNWGEVVATNGAIISTDFTQLILSAPDEACSGGEAWTLTLNDGFALKALADAEGCELISD